MTDNFEQGIKDPCAPLRAGPFVVGAVDEVNGESSQEVEGFGPTKHELEQLARYWIERDLGIRFFEFWSGQTGSSEMRIKTYAWQRVNSIVELLGRDVVETIEGEVYEEFGKKQDAQVWDIYLHGTREHRHAVQEQVHRSFHGDTEEQWRAVLDEICHQISSAAQDDESEQGP